MSKRTITITASRLRTLVAPLMPIAALGDDFGGGLLGGIRLHVTDTSLLASATDRFRVGVVREELPDTADFDIRVRHTDIKRIITILKPTRVDDPVLEITDKGDTFTVEHTGAMFDALKMSIRTESNDGPDLYNLLIATLSRSTGTQATAVNPAYLSQFALAQREAGDRLEITVTDNEKGPVVVRVGDHFIGALMPLRRSADAGLATDWTAILNAAGRKAAA